MLHERVRACFVIFDHDGTGKAEEDAETDAEDPDEKPSSKQVHDADQDAECGEQQFPQAQPHDDAIGRPQGRRAHILSTSLTGSSSLTLRDATERSAEKAGFGAFTRASGCPSF